MKFNAELFKTDEYSSYDTKYVKEYNGAFYDVYLDENDEFHMAKEDRASLLERVHFYNEYLSKGRYPVYTETSAELYETQRPEDIVAQVLGLPMNVMTKKRKNGDTYMLPVTEIIDRIHFEDGLYRGYGTIDGPLNDRFLNGNHFSLIGAMNYLIENGIFFQNLERIYDPYRDDPSYYPIYVDETKIPKRYLEEVENGEKLFFDFFSHPLMITKENYRATFATIDKMTFAEKIAFAFESLDEKESIMMRELRVCIRNYFFAICRSLINEFYKREFHRTVLYTTVLDTAFEYNNTTFSDFYIGPVFMMYRTKSYVLSKVEGEYVRQEIYSPYFCFEEDKRKMKRAFEGVKRYFAVHPKLSYMPMLFIKLMGLPYPAYERMKFFDFERGNVNQFLTLLYADYFRYDSPIHTGMLLPLYTPGGILVPHEECQSYLPFYHNHFMPDVFYNEPAFFSERYAEDYLCFHGKTKDSLLFFGGNSDLYDYIFELSGKEDSDIFRLIHGNRIENGCYTLIRDFFSYMNEGYTASEASSMLSIDDRMDPHFFAMSMVYLFYAYNYDKADKKIGNLLLRPNFSRLPAMNMVVLDENNQGKVYEMNRNFITIIEEGRRRPLLSDKNEVDLVMKFFNDWHYRMYSCVQSSCVCGKTDYIKYFNDYAPQDIISPAMYNNWEFSSSSNPLDDEKLYDALSDIPEIRYELAFRKSIDYGIFLYGEDETPRALALLKKDLLPKTISYLLSEELLSILYFGSQYDDYVWQQAPLTKPEFKSIYKRVFTHNYGDVPSVGRMEEPAEQYLYTYSGYFQKAWYESLSGYTDSAFFGYYKTKDKDGKDLYIAPGDTFSAFSHDEDIESFAFSSKDIPMMIEIIKNSIEFAVSARSKHKAEIATCHTGLPYLFYTKLLKMINRQEEINEETLRRYFNFTDEEFDLNAVDAIENHFFHKKTDLQNLSLPVEVKRSLLSDGFYCSPNCNIHLIEVPENPINNSDALNKPFDIGEECRVDILSDIKGVVKQYLLPDVILYESMVNDLIERCMKTNKTKWNLFYVKEFLLCSYYEDNEILLKWIDIVQHHYTMCEHFYPFYFDKVDKHTIFQGKDMVHHYTMFYYVFEFLILIEQKIIMIKRKEILEK